MGMIQEFKTFAMRGNVVDMAVGIIIGGAFGKNRVFVRGGCHHAADRYSGRWR